MVTNQLRGCISALLLFSAALQAQVQVSYSEYAIPGGGNPSLITTGPDGALWFLTLGTGISARGSNASMGRVTTAGSITQYAIPNTSGDMAPAGLTAGPDGALWFTIANFSCCGGVIGRVSTAGSVTEFPLPAGISPGPIAAGPDGALWFIASNASTTMIDRMTTAGNLTNQFSVPVGFTSPWRLGVLVGTGITAGPDGALWFFSSNVSMGRLSTQGTFTQYPLPAAGDTCCFSGPVAGPDGALWFDDNGWTGRITTSGTVTQFGLNDQNQGGLYPITLGSDGAFWGNSNGVLDGLPPTLERVTTAGTRSAYTVTSAYAGHAHLVDTTTGPDGALWITDANSSGVIGGAILRVGITPAPVISGSGPPLGALGGSYSATLSTTGGTPPYSNWTVSNGSLPPGLTLDPATGTIQGVATAAGTFNFSVTAQDSTGVTSAPQIVSITIDAPVSGLSFIGSMPHVAAEENWTTWFTLVNKGTAAATARLSLFGDPCGTLPLPLTFPQLPAGANSIFTASIDRTIAGNASSDRATAGPQTPPVKVGSAQLAATGTVDGFAIFHQVLTQQETVVPLETRNASSYLLAYDNTGGNVLGVAVAGITTPSGSAGVLIDIRDDTGNELLQDGFNVEAGGHVSFLFPTLFPITANRRGTIELSPIPGNCNLDGNPGYLHRTDQCSGHALHTAEQCADDDSRAGQCRYWRREHRSYRHRQRLANHFRTGEYGYQRGTGAVEFLRR